MCRLFGLTAGEVRVKAKFWLLDAPDSLQVQSHRNADGDPAAARAPGAPARRQPEHRYLTRTVRSAC